METKGEQEGFRATMLHNTICKQGSVLLPARDGRVGYDVVQAVQCGTGSTGSTRCTMQLHNERCVGQLSMRTLLL